MRAIASALIWFAFACAASAQAPTVEDFTRDRSVWSARLSPDGRHVAAIVRRGAQDAVIILDWRTGEARAIQTADTPAGVDLDWVAWKSNSRLIFSAIHNIPLGRVLTGTTVRRDEGNKQSVERIYATDSTGANLVEMFESQAMRIAVRFASTRVVDPMPQDPNHVLMSTWDRSGLALFRVNISNGRLERTQVGTDTTFRWHVDGEGKPVLRFDVIGVYGGYRIFRRDPAGADWIEIMEVRATEHAEAPDFDVLGAGPGSGRVYVSARSQGQDRAAVYLYDAATGQLGEPLYQHAASEGFSIWSDPRSRALWAACANAQRAECTIFDAEKGRHLTAIRSLFERDAGVRLIDTSEDGAVWLILAESPTMPPAYFVYDRAQTRLTSVSSVRPQLRPEQLSRTETVTYRTRDGVEIWGYLTTPRGVQSAAPLVVMPHGGPEGRDVYGFDELVQFLASRGYLVFQPQFRGSGGFGRAFAELGYRQWGQRMQDDVTDGVRHLIEAGRADARRICVVGFSYGGYAALAGAAFTPELYQCAISYAGPSDLLELVRDTRKYGGTRSAGFEYDRRSIGDPDRDHDMLIRYSPRRHVGQIRIPILLIHGEADNVVFFEQSEYMEDALKDAGKPVRLISLPHRGHSYAFWDDEERAMLFREIEGFLATHLGARDAQR